MVAVKALVNWFGWRLEPMGRGNTDLIGPFLLETCSENIQLFKLDPLPQ